MSYSKGDVILFPYPFTDLKTMNVRPAVVASSEGDLYEDVFVVPLTSRLGNLGGGEFILHDWSKAGLNVKSAVKRGCVLVDTALIRQRVGALSRRDVAELEDALRQWLDL